MKTDEHDELWDLLGRARDPEVSPFFSRNVLREVRNLRQERPSFWRWLRRHWQIPAVTLAAFALAVGAVFEENAGGVRSVPTKALSTPMAAVALEDPQLLVMAERVSDSPDYRVIGNLDELLDSEHNSIWLGSDAY
jgi:hypothetical protein